MSTETAGNQVALHFMAMAYLLEGPPRIVRELETELLLNPTQAGLWLKHMVRLGHMSVIDQQNAKQFVSKAIRYKPTKVIVDADQYADMCRRLGMTPPGINT